MRASMPKRWPIASRSCVPIPSRVPAMSAAISHDRLCSTGRTPRMHQSQRVLPISWMPLVRSGLHARVKALHAAKAMQSMSRREERAKGQSLIVACRRARTHTASGIGSTSTAAIGPAAPPIQSMARAMWAGQPKDCPHALACAAKRASSRSDRGEPPAIRLMRARRVSDGVAVGTCGMVVTLGLRRHSSAGSHHALGGRRSRVSGVG